MALAHAVGDKVEAAYRRGDMFQKRRQLAEPVIRLGPTPLVGRIEAGHRRKLLDIACGTGNQRIANRGLAPDARLVGSLGMLRQARRKMPDIAWVHGDSAALPFASGSFDFVSCQYAFHHFRDKAGMLREAFRVLRPGGRFALYNMCPQESDDWLYYAYFPEAKTRDFADFWPPARSYQK